MLVLCGIPGSGKSTIAAALATAAKATGTLVTLVDFDKQAGDLLEEFDPEKWKKYRATSLESIAQALDSSQRKISNSEAASATTTASSSSSSFINDSTMKTRKHLLIIDDTMHYRSMRAECWRIARATGAAYLHAHIKCPLERALERNQLRPPGQRVPEKVVRRTAAIFEPPEENQHCLYDSDAYKVLLDIEDSVPNKENGSDLKSLQSGWALWTQVDVAWGPPTPAPFDERAEKSRITEARRNTAESLLHHVDVQTRKYLTEVVSSSSSIAGGKQARRKIAEDLNRERRHVLERIRTELSSKKFDIYDDEHASEVIEGFQKFCRERERQCPPS
jgi:tRNA uridine 5-carbamoylmethylation protein Kti12